MSETIKTLADLGQVYDGAVETLFQRAIVDIVADLEARPLIKTARTASVEIKASPRVDSAGRLTGAVVQVAVKDRLPVVHTGDIAMQVQSDGLSYEPLAPDNPHQTVLAFGAPERKAAAAEG